MFVTNASRDHQESNRNETKGINNRLVEARNLESIEVKIRQDAC